MLSLRDSDSPWLSEFVTISRDSRGFLYGASIRFDPGVVRVHDATGALIARYGRRGAGPGEGRGVGAPFLGPRDTAYALDIMLGRFNVWSPEFRFVRSFSAPGRVTDAVLISAREIVVSATVQTREHAGWPLHVLSTSDGAILRSFGSDEPSYRYDASLLNRRMLAVSRSGRIWAAHHTQYVIEQYDWSGMKQLEIRRTVDWFQPNDGRRQAGAPPPAAIYGLWEAQDGLLWVIIGVPDANYSQNRDRLEVRDGMRVVRAGDNRGLTDTILEVIDPRTGTLMASRRFDEALSRWASGPLYAYRENGAGEPLYDIYAVRLVRQ